MSTHARNINASLPSMPRLVQLLGQIIVGDAAKQQLEQVNEAPETGTVTILPQWAWLLPGIDVGRKATSFDGSKRTFPVRLHWPSALIVSDDSPEKVAGELIGMGHRGPVTAGVHTFEDDLAAQWPGASDTVSPLQVNFTTRTNLRRLLTDLVKTGEGSRWELMHALEPFAARKLMQANTHVAVDVGMPTEVIAPTVVDQVTIDQLTGELLLGVDGAESSIISRLIARSCLPETFMRVDPMHYIAMRLRAAAREAIERHIGEPKVGPKVRRIMRKIGPATVDELIAEYRKAYPNDSLARKRAIAAITAGADVNANQVLFSEAVSGLLADHLWDEVPA